MQSSFPTTEAANTKVFYPYNYNEWSRESHLIQARPLRIPLGLSAQLSGKIQYFCWQVRSLGALVYHVQLLVVCLRARQGEEDGIQLYYSGFSRETEPTSYVCIYASLLDVGSVFQTQDFLDPEPIVVSLTDTWLLKHKLFNKRCQDN